MPVLTFILRYRKIILRTASVCALLLLSIYIIRGATTPPRIIQLDPITKVIEVPVEKITTKTVTKYVKIEDRAAAARLLADNNKLQSKVEQLTMSLAESKSRGQGETVITVPSSTTDGIPIVVQTPINIKFKDWRLNFQSTGSTGSYVLSQKFSILNTVGRTKHNDPVNIVRLFEIGKNGERIPIPTVETTTVSVMPDQMGFYIRPTMQTGVAVLPEWQSRSTNTTSGGTTKYPVFAVIGVPWWKRGTIQTPEHTRYAYLTPVVSVNGEQIVAGVLPVSANLGTLQHSPVTDLWASPFFGISSKNATKKFGIIFTTTF